MIYLQSINRWLRFTGFRLAVSFHEPLDGPIGFGLRWFGWSFLRDFEWDCRPWQRVNGAWEKRP